MFHIPYRAVGLHAQREHRACTQPQRSTTDSHHEVQVEFEAGGFVHPVDVVQGLTQSHRLSHETHQVIQDVQKILFQSSINDFMGQNKKTDDNALF